MTEFSNVHMDCMYTFIQGGAKTKTCVDLVVGINFVYIGHCATNTYFDRGEYGVWFKKQVC